LDNIPIVSWIVLRGRCRTCRAPISPRYPVIEAATAALWVACALRFDTLEEAAFSAAAVTVLLALAAIDLEHRRLPNVIVLPGTAVAIVWVAGVAASEGETDVLLTALACGAAAFALFFLIAFASGGMGMGDVKLAGFIGVVTGRFGWEVTVAAVFASFFIGGGLAIGLLLARRVGRKQAIPFGPSMAAGAVLALFAGTGPVRSWLGL
jgi:leader peptidase (prepilin peptidase)/N-methyltransferase